MTQQNAEVQEVTTVSNPTSERVVRQTRVVTPTVETGEVILAFRVVLKLLGASTFSGFTNFIYAMSSPFALPFAGILGVTGVSGMVLEWSTLIAMVVYAIIAYGIVALFQLVKPTNQEEVEQTVDNQ